MNIQTTIRVWREGKHFIAHALPLDVASAGDTPENARSALREAVELFIATAREHGTLDETLEECGYTFDGAKWVAPLIVAEQQDILGLISLMPRIIPVSWRRLEKVFIAVGFVFTRQVGSHRSYLKTGVARPVVIPTYDEIPVFIIRNNLRTAGLSREEYLRLLDKVG